MNKEDSKAHKYSAKTSPNWVLLLTLVIIMGSLTIPVYSGKVSKITFNRWMGTTKNNGTDACTLNLRMINAGLEMAIIDDAGYPYVLQPQTKPGQQNLAGIPDGKLRNLVAQGYVKKELNAFICPGGGLLHINYGGSYCTKHGFLGFDHESNSVKYISSKPDSSGIIEYGGDERYRATIFFWDDSVITVFKIHNEDYCHISTPSFLWFSTTAKAAKNSAETVRIHQSKDLTELVYGKGLSTDCKVDMSKHPSLQKVMKMLPSILETKRFLIMDLHE